jgi:hypothetical protein
MTLFPINENHSGENSASHEKINPRLEKKNNGFSAAAKTCNNYNACEKLVEGKIILTIHLYSQQGLKNGAVEFDLLNCYGYHLIGYSHDCLPIYQKFPGRIKQSKVKQAVHCR